MSTILMTYGNRLNLPDEMRDFELIQPPQGKFFDRQTLLERLPRCDAVIAADRFDRELIAACEQAKIIVCYGAGYDHFDLTAATERRIPVVNIPDSVTESTAQLAVALMLAVTRRIGELDRKMHTSASTRDLFFIDGMLSVELKGMTLGVVGMGRIGTRVAMLASAFGMRIVYYGRSESKPWPENSPVRLPLRELLQTADIVTLHCPLTAETQGMLGREELALLKPGAYLINTARGKLVDEQALIEALEENRIAGAGLDVYAQEPEIAERLKRLDNAVLLPHIGGNTRQTRLLMARQCFEQINRALRGQKPDNLLNPQVWG